jgi:two-component system, OmpR family, sensor kinase
VGHDGFRGGLATGWLLGRASLWVRLVATTLCALAAGATVITGACALLARSFLMGQADQQLRAYAGGLISRPFAASPLYGVGPGAPAAGMPGGVFGIEIRGPGGQLVMRAGPAAGPGPVIPAVPARVAARTGPLVTVAAGRGVSWRVIAEPIHYRARRIPFSYSAEGFSVSVTGLARPGLAGTLVVGVDLGPIGRTAGGLAVTGLAVSGVMVLIAGGLGALAIRAILRPLTQAEGTLAAAAAGELSRRVPERHSGTDASGLTGSLNNMLSRTEHAFSTCAGSETFARRSGERMSRIIAGTCQELRRPLSVIHGLAGPGGHRGRLSAGELDHRMKRVASEAARLDALVDDLLLSGRDQQPPQR